MLQPLSMLAWWVTKDQASRLRIYADIIMVTGEEEDVAV